MIRRRRQERPRARWRLLGRPPRSISRRPLACEPPVGRPVAATPAARTPRMRRPLAASRAQLSRQRVGERLRHEGRTGTSCRLIRRPAERNPAPDRPAELVGGQICETRIAHPAQVRPIKRSRAAGSSAQPTGLEGAAAAADAAIAPRRAIDQIGPTECARPTGLSAPVAPVGARATRAPLIEPAGIELAARGRSLRKRRPKQSASSSIFGARVEAINLPLSRARIRQAGRPARQRLNQGADTIAAPSARDHQRRRPSGAPGGARAPLMSPGGRPVAAVRPSAT